MTPHGSGRPWWRNLTDGIRTRLWPVPAVAIMLSIAVGVALPVYDAGLLQRLPSGLAAYLFSGGPEAARSVLQTVAGSLITVTSLTFSLTIVTLQLASGQYSPRLLRTFTRDRVVHATLAMLLATFTYALTVLRTVRTQDDAAGAFVPRLSVTTAYLLALFSVMTVAGFLAHLARKIRVESMLRDVHAEAARTLRQNLSPRDRSVEASDTPTPPDAAVMVLCAHASGFVTSVDEKELLTAALDSDAVIQVGRSPGESIVAGTPVARAWPVDGRQPTDEHWRRTLQRSVTGAVRLGFERTSAHDVAFGLRQLTDVAVKALSPAVNDPTTAVHALGHSAALLCEAAGRDLGPRVLCDDAGRTRVVLPRPTFAALLDLAISQPRRYGAQHPEVLLRLFDLLREAAWVAPDGSHRRAVADQLARLRATATAQDFDDFEQATFSRRASLVDSALHHQWPGDG